MRDNSLTDKEKELLKILNEEAMKIVDEDDRIVRKTVQNPI